MPVRREPEIRAPSNLASLESVRADQEIAAIKNDSLKGQHALEIKITELQTTIKFLATKSELEKAKLQMTWAWIGAGISILAALGSLFGTLQ